MADGTLRASFAEAGFSEAPAVTAVTEAQAKIPPRLLPRTMEASLAQSVFFAANM